ncbi:sterol desaturase family protein [Pleionea sp. CnH1-48]|uniref:sterol desaturase family protein n=1 Tax=Pleionea sp. CnH1-48 TaxID=2954494 RepID=UPI002097CB0C|nr:sterol desaturase family protein [Pleionea sp. CnH1-48]MCO7223459.1 sterol desaturase family protein [Pleionea sp. CnH1-48]
MPLLDTLTATLKDLSLYWFDAGQRIYLIYLAGAVLLAIPVFVMQSRRRSIRRFLKFLFPKKIWLASSAKQDYGLLIINKVIRGLLLAPVIVTMVPIALAVTDALEWLFGPVVVVSESKPVIMFSFTVLLFVLDDLSRFILHYLLHKVPFLWEFHKVHHSAKVLTPFTVYRSHPFENYLFACRLAIAQGLAVGISYYLFGPTLSVIEFAGANIFVFLFNIMGSNLRHSHIWLSWGETLEHWFISPAQHQIHHSANPIHFDKNMGSALAIWDRLAGTLVTAKDTPKLKFGFGDKFKEHDTLLGIYWQPLKLSFMQLLSLVGINKKKQRKPAQ